MSWAEEDEFSDDENDIEFLRMIDQAKVTLNGNRTDCKNIPTKIDPPLQAIGSGKLEYEQVPENPLTLKSSHLIKSLNYDNLSTIIYPTNFEVRDYQFNIVNKALFENLICAIPTGLGKTFIAATIMLNFFRWTSNNMKIIFMAPTKPLVAQQIKAFIQITGISMTFTDILLDKTKKNRLEIWNSKKVLFATPQVIDNDLKNGLLDPKNVACLIIDEAHRSTGNYAYVNVIKFLNRFNPTFRVLALTATPGADIESVQTIVDNLNISSIEIYTENDPDIKKYIKNKEIEKFDCEQNEEIGVIIDMISEAIRPALEKANSAGIYEITDPSRINHFIAMEKSRKIQMSNMNEGLKWSYFFLLQLLGTVGLFYRRLNIYGIKTFYNYFIEKFNEFTLKYNMKKSTNKLAANFYFDDKIKQLKHYIETLILDDKTKALKENSVEGIFAHTKFHYLVDELIMYFQEHKYKTSSCIIFTELRESALEIVHVLESVNKSLGEDLIKPHIFIGQSKEKDKFDQQKYVDKYSTKKQKKHLESKGMEPSLKSKIDCLNTENGLRSSERTISSDDAQVKGMNQKTQKKLIEDFKKGKYNVLVATSIGEEGLDIGEVDLIVCFDSTQSPIKNIQRMGRTGRKRDGKVILLFSSNERTKFETAMGRYDWIQGQIAAGNNLRFVKNPSNRIIPPNIHPIVEKKYIEIPKENEELLRNSDLIDDEDFLKLATQTIRKKPKTTSKGNSKTAVNKKSNQKVIKQFFVPDNAELGFKSANNMIRKINTDNLSSDTRNNVDTTFTEDDDLSLLNNSANLSVVDMFSNIAGLDDEIKAGDASKDSILIPGSNQVLRAKTANTDNASVEIAPALTDNNESHNEKKNTPNLIDLTGMSDDEFSDISLGEIEKNVLTNDRSQALDSIVKLEVSSTPSFNPRETHQNSKASSYNPSSDPFSDDDELLLAELNKISEKNRQANEQY